MNAEAPISLARRARRALLRPVLTRVAKAYVAGETVHDAGRVQARFELQGLRCTLGYWDDERDTPRGVADEYLAALPLLRAGDSVSIKVHALDYSETLLSELTEQATRRAITVHIDSVGPEIAQRCRDTVERFLAKPGPAPLLGYTLPGRWKRSQADAAWVVERRLPVRVVKGQFPDDATADPREGYRRVVEALAGKAVHVGVATHDVPLAEASLRTLAQQGTSRQLELLYGLPTRASLRSARAMGEQPRMYIGYGKAHLPYAVSRVIDNPRMLLWLARDFLRL